jgi:DNA-binding XRE family transcriptional regulator
MKRPEVNEWLVEESASWTESDWEQYRLISLAMSVESQKIHLAWLIKSARKRAQYSQRQLAKLTQVQQSEISKIEKCKGNPTLNTLFKLFVVLGIEASYRLPDVVKDIDEDNSEVAA